MNKPFLLGVTGGIGSGKSIVCKIMHTMGIPTYDADSRAKYLMNHEDSLKEKIIALFGNESYKEGELNRAYLANTVFNDEQKLGQLNALVHPAVGHDFEQWIAKHAQEPLLVKEAALLFETGSAEKLDKVLLVSAPEQLRIERVLKRDLQRTEEQVKAIIAKQWPEDKKQGQADFVLHNDEKKLLIPQVLQIVSTITK